MSRTDRNDHRPHRGWSRRLHRALRNAIMLTATCTFIPPARTQDLPDGMVFLAAVDPSIRQDIRYAGSNNFTGRPVAGYLVGECILAKPVAYALARAQAALLPRYSLKVFDCYRPLRAVADFLAWSRTTGQEHTRTAYYPDLRKGDLFARGFIARRSRHTRGTAVDVTIIEIADTAPVLPVQSLSTPCSSSLEARLHDSNLDYGTGFDCFSAKSSTNSALISPEARRNRRRLVAAMRKVGFTNYGKEWWHFELDGLADFAERDIPISARSGPAVGARSTQEGCGSPQSRSFLRERCRTHCDPRGAGRDYAQQRRTREPAEADVSSLHRTRTPAGFREARCALAIHRRGTLVRGSLGARRGRMGGR